MCHTLLINREGQRESSLYSHCQSLTQNLCSATEAVPVLGPHVSLQQPGEAEVWALLKKQSYALLPLSFFAPEKKKCFFLFFFSWFRAYWVHICIFAHANPHPYSGRLSVWSHRLFPYDLPRNPVG